MENWKVELAIGGETLVEMIVQKEIFHGDLFSPLLFVIAIMPINYIPRSYKFTKSQKKINYLIYMDDIKIFTKKKKKN